MIIKKNESGTTPQQSASKQFTVALKRRGTAVHVIFGAKDEYSAIELFDSLQKGAESGSFNLGAAL
jgi:hypothetical protein